MFTSRGSFGPKCRQSGFTLVEAVIFIAVVAVGISGVLLAINVATRDSVDPLIHKQAVAIAESMLQEIESMPFTFCDPDDPAVSTAANPAGCATQEGIGPEGETRAGATPFDNVNDYAGYDTAADGGIKDVTGTPVAGLGAYRARVAVAAVALGDITQASGDALQITVTVTGPTNVTVTLDGYRTRYAPNL